MFHDPSHFVPMPIAQPPVEFVSMLRSRPAARHVAWTTGIGVGIVKRWVHSRERFQSGIVETSPTSAPSQASPDTFGAGGTT